jgi:transcriptional regulator with XRE-family HTH domain
MSRENVVRRFGRHIRKLREARGINQTVLAERIGTEQSKISLMENGKQEPRLTFIHELAGALRMSLGEVFKDFR